MLFVDTGAFLARHLARDQYHSAALTAWQQLADEPQHLYTTNYVLDETITLLARRAGYQFAATQARTWFGSDVLEILRPAASEELRALDMFEKFADQGVSFTDCTSFVVMADNGISQVFGYDHHFERAGYSMWPSSAAWSPA